MLSAKYILVVAFFGVLILPLPGQSFLKEGLSPAEREALLQEEAFRVKDSLA